MTTHDRLDQDSEADRTDSGADRTDGADLTTVAGGALDLLRVAAVVLDADGRITLWSPEAELLFGYSAAEALGRRADRLLVHPRDRRAAVDLFARVRAGDTWAGVFPVRRRDGATVRVEFHTM